MEHPKLDIQEQRATEQLETLYAVNNLFRQAEADGLNIHVILPRILNIAIKQLNAYDGSIIIVNDQLQIEHAWFANHLINEKTDTSFLNEILKHGLAGWVIRNKQPIIIHDTRTDSRWLRRPSHITSEEPWSVICTPFLIRARAIGAITIHKAGENQFDTRDLNLLKVISNQAAAIIENARLFERSQRQLRISALLNEASRVINSSLDINEIMQSLLTQMNELLHAEAISIALVDKQTNELVYQVAEGIGSDKIVGLRLPANRGISGWVMEHGKPVLVADTSKDSRFDGLGDKRTGYHTQSMICAPIQHKEQVLGTIQAINPIGGGDFTDEDLNLLVNLANIASSAIANAQQYARTQAAEARYLNLFQDSVDPIILTDLEGKIVEANRRAFEFLGYPRQELIGKPIYSLHKDTAAIPSISEIQKESVTIFRSQIQTKQKVVIHVEVHAKCTLFQDSELLQWIHHDISKQVELEEMRRDLTAMLFHDLQSPLGNVISSLELLRYELVGYENEVVDSILEIALRSSQRLETLIHSLLDINTLEAGHPVTKQEKAELHKLVNEIYEMERPNLEKRGIELVCHFEENLPYLHVETDMIRRVLLNLLDNALKYSQQSQKITIEAVHLPDQKMMQISVSDQGKGIPPEYREKIFEKFQRIKLANEYSKGLGLGLAFCRLAVEAHGGRIWVDDAPGGGARFNFTLPIYEGK
ncbi:MAG: GAF domain-containing protein [Chloroflexi bacterium]|nr:MAG: GAF domain-containing protein [Chloroflexota bacterium]